VIPGDSAVIILLTHIDHAQGFDDFISFFSFRGVNLNALA